MDISKVFVQNDFFITYLTKKSLTESTQIYAQVRFVHIFKQQELIDPSIGSGCLEIWTSSYAAADYNSSDSDISQMIATNRMHNSPLARDIN